jgi:diaminopimelate epimerase
MNKKSTSGKLLPFIKMHGLGNSYVYVDCFRHPIENYNLGELAQQIACPATGIGSDGLILICPSQKADLKMRIFNKDGSEGKNCGNGIRCVAAYAYQNDLVESKKMSIETLAGIVNADVLSENGLEAIVSVNMGQPQLSGSQIPMKGSNIETVVNESFMIDGIELKLTAISMGNPHAVFFAKESNHQLHLSLGPKIEKDSRFPEGVNVEFITMKSGHKMRCRVWERGSGPTKACGTGACAAVVAAILNGKAKRDQLILVELDGGSLEICWRTNGDVWMTGPAVLVAHGFFAK